jgi:hypothetical protein
MASKKIKHRLRPTSRYTMDELLAAAGVVAERKELPCTITVDEIRHVASVLTKGKSNGKSSLK